MGGARSALVLGEAVEKGQHCTIFTVTQICRKGRNNLMESMGVKAKAIGGSGWRSKVSRGGRGKVRGKVSGGRLKITFSSERRGVDTKLAEKLNALVDVFPLQVKNNKIGFQLSSLSTQTQRGTSMCTAHLHSTNEFKSYH